MLKIDFREVFDVVRFSKFADFRGSRATDQAAAHTLLSGRDVNFLDPCQRDGCQLPVSYGNVDRMSALRPKAVVQRRLRRIPKFPKLELSYREVPGE